MLLVLLDLDLELPIYHTPKSKRIKSPSCLEVTPIERTKRATPLKAVSAVYANGSDMTNPDSGVVVGYWHNWCDGGGYQGGNAPLPYSALFL